jgi:hypothetical protein
VELAESGQQATGGASAESSEEAKTPAPLHRLASPSGSDAPPSMHLPQAFSYPPLTHRITPTLNPVASSPPEHQSPVREEDLDWTVIDAPEEDRPAAEQKAKTD